MSPLWIGRRQSIGIGNETIRGVGVEPSYWVNATSFSFRDVADRALSEASFGGIWGGDQSPQTLKRAEGEMEVELDDQSLGSLLKALFGSVSSATEDTSAYKHIYTLSNTNIHDSLSITTVDPIGQLLFEMAMVDSFEITIEPNSIIGASISFISKSSVPTSGYTASYGSTKKWLGRHLTFKMADTTSGLDEADSTDLKSLTLTFEKNAEANQTLSSVQPTDIVNKRFNVTMSITLDYRDRTWLDYVKDGSYKAVRVNLVHDDLAGDSTAYYEFKLDLSKCSIESFDPDFSLDDVVTQSFTLNALYSATDDNVINDCFLINQQESY